MIPGHVLQVFDVESTVVVDIPQDEVTPVIIFAPAGTSLVTFPLLLPD